MISWEIYNKNEEYENLNCQLFFRKIYPKSHRIHLLSHELLSILWTRFFITIDLSAILFES